MRKATLIKYIKKETSPEEEVQVLDWIEKNEENRHYYISLKNTWIRSSMPQGEASQQEFETFLSDHSSLGFHATPETNSKKEETQNRHMFRRISGWSVAAVIACGLFLNAYIFRNWLQIQPPIDNTPVAENFPSGSPKMHTIYTDKGVKGIVVLPDSSTVWLNSDSRLTYPDQFTGTTREIFLTGEGYFKVKKDSLQPMIVHTRKNFYVKVLGTEFNLSCYENDTFAKAVLYTGKINLISLSETDKKENSTQMLPNESCTISSGKIQITPPANHIRDSLWKAGILTFEAEPMADVMKKLERWHGAKFTVKNNKIYNNKINARFKDESLVQVMELIGLCSNITYKIDGVNIELDIK